MSIETNRVFDFKLNEKGIKQVSDAKFALGDFQELILGQLKPGREASIVKTKMEELGYSITRAIAMQEENYTEINTY